MRYFLLVYDKAAEELIAHFDYSVEDRAAALEKRRALQALYRLDPAHEVVLLGAERYEDLAKTHGRYFKKTEQLSQVASNS